MAPIQDDEFLRELWALYALGTLWILLRFAVRLRVAGFPGLRLDDGLAFVALATWTYTCAVTHIIYYTGTNVGFTPAEVALFDERQIEEVEYGSKLFLAGWYTNLVFIFSLKGIILVLYHRLFFERWQIWMFRIIVTLCLTGFTALTLALTLDCLPFRMRWQIAPPPPLQCTASPKILISASCVNALTDVLLITVPVPVLWTLHKPLCTRLVVFILLSSGVFALAACITRISLTIVPNISLLVIVRWAIREFAVAIVAVNSASLRPMFHRSFWSSRKTPGRCRPSNVQAAAVRQRFDAHIDVEKTGELRPAGTLSAKTPPRCQRSYTKTDLTLQDTSSSTRISLQHGEYPSP